MEIVPTITIDCVDGIELYMNAKALQAEIISSKSSAVNISVPGASGDYVRISDLGTDRYSLLQGQLR
jgi:adenylyl cyclase-associated protein